MERSAVATAFDFPRGPREGVGNSYTGTNELKMYDLSGNLTNDLLGTASATRIEP
jgi:hypothetical protein